MNRQNSTRKPARRMSATTVIVMLSVIVIFAATSGFAQYQIKKPAALSQQKASISVTEPAGGTIWEKGQRYAIKWTSEGRVSSVKIVLIDQADKSHNIVRTTTNSGSYNYTVSTRLADGAYKVVIMTSDGSVKGEASGTVTIQKKSFGTKATKSAPAGGGTAEPPESPAVAPRSLPGVTRPSGQVGTQPEGAQPGDLTPTKEEDMDSPDLADFLIGDAAEATSATISVVVGNLPASQVSAAEKSELDLSLLQPVGEPEPSGSVSRGEITFTQPRDSAIWLPGEQYQIAWTSEGVDGPVGFKLRSPRPADERIITTSAAASGSMLYTVPPDLKLGHNNYRLEARNESGNWLGFVKGITVYETQAVDLMCVIRNETTNNYRTDRRGNRHYYFAPGGSRVLDFDIAVINEGTRGPITVPILVRLVKKPEQVVIYQMQAGFGDVHPGFWYMTNGAIHWDVRELEANYTSGSGSGIDFGEGGYRIYVTADVGNSLGEREELTYDNSDMVYITIGHR